MRHGKWVGASMALLAGSAAAMFGAGALGPVIGNGAMPAQAGQDPSRYPLARASSLLAGAPVAEKAAFAFQVPRTMYPGGVPLQIAAADFNGDRRQDLVAVVDTTPEENPGGLELRVFLKDANGAPVAPPLIAPVSDYPDALSVADLNRDGRQDLILSVPSGPQVALGTADGTVSLQALAPRYGDGSTLAVALDFDLDDDLDVVTVLGGVDIHYYANDGRGRFAPGVQVGGAGFMNALWVADVSGDGKNDLIASAGHYYVVFGDPGTGRVDVLSTGALGLGALTGATGDWNSDGRDDLVFSMDDFSWLSQLLQRPDGTLGEDWTPVDGFYRSPDAMVRADLQGDGIDDLVTVSYWGATYSLQADGKLGEPTTIALPEGYPEGNPTARVAVGDVIGNDGCQDILFARNAPWITVYQGENCRRPAAAPLDFDGEGRGDVVWRNAATGANEMWPNANRNARVVLGTLAPEWSVAAAGDFDGNGKADLFWRNNVTGANSIWRSAQANLSLLAMSQYDVRHWKVAGVGDFDNDGRDDLFWRHAGGDNRIWRSGDGRLQVWVDPVSNTVFGNDTGWQVAGIGDFTGDGKDDVFWRNGDTGGNDLWPSALRTQRRYMTAVTSLDWKVAGVADFNGDGNADILWRNAVTGANVMWMFGRATSQRKVQTVADVNWQVAGVADYDRDGKADILWRHKLTGGNELWGEGKVKYRKVLPAVPTSWSVATARN